MKRQSLFFLLLLSISTFAQVKFAKGYFIDNNASRTECLIRDIGWKSNPKQFDYKLAENSEVKTGTLKTVQEFGVDNQTKFIRATVMIDRSTDNLNALTYVKEPKFTEEQLFLKEIVDGKASLYQYEEPNFLRFFYQTNEGKIDQLIYKRYQYDANQVAYNDGFKDQIEKNMVCAEVNNKRINNLKYQPENLTSLFRDYNRCADPSYVEIEKEVRKGISHLSIRPRVNFSSFNADDDYFDFHTRLESQTKFSAGIEAEYIFPFNKNKWALIIEPSYQYYKAEAREDNPNIGGRIVITSVDFSAIELPIGIRHYMYLNKDSRLFLNVLYSPSIKIGDKIELKRSDNSVFETYDVNPRANFAAGIGFSYKSKFGAEFRVNSNKSLVGGGAGYQTQFKSSSLILSYTFL